MIKRSEISLELPTSSLNGHLGASESMFSDAFSTEQEMPFNKLIESSQTLHSVYEMTSAGDDIDLLERQIPELEEEVRCGPFQSPSSISANRILPFQIARFRASLDPGCLLIADTMMQQTSELPRNLLFPVVLVNTNIFIAQWILRLRLLVLKTAQRLRTGIDEQLRGTSSSLHHDLVQTALAAASMIKMAQALPSDQANIHW